MLNIPNRPINPASAKTTVPCRSAIHRAMRRLQQPPPLLPPAYRPMNRAPTRGCKPEAQIFPAGAPENRRSEVSGHFCYPTWFVAHFFRCAD